jgi:hypothetical protein
MTIFSQLDEDILFPDRDGKPIDISRNELYVARNPCRDVACATSLRLLWRCLMADNTEQYRWIVIIKENL